MKVFPKIGEPVDDFDKLSGDVCITELQLPAIKTWESGQPYRLLVDVVMVKSDYEQDSEYDEMRHKRIATSNPYLKAKFEITGIQEAKTEKSEKG